MGIGVIIGSVRVNLDPYLFGLCVACEYVWICETVKILLKFMYLEGY